MYSPVAVMSLVITCRVISVATELLRTSTGCTNPSFSLIIYADWLKLTDTTTWVPVIRAIVFVTRAQFSKVNISRLCEI